MKAIFKMENAMKQSLLIGTLVLMSCAQSAVHANAEIATLPAPVTTYQQRLEAATPRSVLDWLKFGNERFAKGKSTHGGYLVDARERVMASAPSQRPLAVVLSCIDSRTSPELVFDTSVGDLFTVRVGANVINDDVLGSLEIAVDSGARVLMVLGHTDCGGVKGACSNLQLGHMTQLLQRVKPAITATNNRLDRNSELSKEVGERVVGNRRYIAEVSHMNALHSARQIWERSPILREKIKNGELILVSGIYDVDSGLVRFDPPHSSEHREENEEKR
jgi:carbonic anhydrase